MKFWKMVSVLFIGVVFMIGCTSTGPWVSTPVYPEKVVSIEEVKEVVPEKATVTQIKESIMFEYDSSVITPTEMVKVDVIKDLMKEYNDTSIVLKGYASSEGTTDYNSVLAVDRAEAVKAALMEKGIQEDRILVAGFGATKIFGDLLNLNRRVLVLDINK